MNWKNILKILIITVIIVNLPIVDKNFMSLFDGKGHFKYSNADASFTYHESLTFKDGYINSWVINRFIKDNNPLIENKKLYRLYTINPFCFWRWSYYLFTSSHFEYKSWEEIEPNRTPFKEGNMWQDF